MATTDRSRAAILEVELHVDEGGCGRHFCSDHSTVRKVETVRQSTVGVPSPFPSFELDSFLLPHGWNMRVGEELKLPVVPKGLRQIDDDVAIRIPRQKNAEFRLSPRVDCALEKSAPRMAPTGVRPDLDDGVIRRSVRCADRFEGGFFQPRGVKASDGLHLGRRIAMTCHVREPIAQLLLITIFGMECPHGESEGRYQSWAHVQRSHARIILSS